MIKTAHNRQLVMPFGAEAPQVWRPIHYLGSKLRLVEAIRERSLALDPTRGRVCDLFAGSGTVAAAFSADREVVAADIQEYSRVLCSALLRPRPPGSLNSREICAKAERGSLRSDALRLLGPIFELEEQALRCVLRDAEPLCELAESSPLGAKRFASGRVSRAFSEVRDRVSTSGLESKLMATHLFGGAYFSYRQAFDLDCLLDAIETESAASRDTLLAAVISAASTVVNTVGKHFAQPVRPRRRDGSIKCGTIRQMHRDRSLDFLQTFREWLDRYQNLRVTGRHEIISADYRQVLAQLDDVALVYADPPYTRDHYSRFYHVLETLCLGDYHLASINSVGAGSIASRGYYRPDRHQSPFCIKSQAKGAFAELFRGARRTCAPVLLSYSPFVKEGHPRLMTVEGVVAVAKQWYRNVEVTPAGLITHSKLNRSDLHLEVAKHAEVFVTCRP